MPHTRKKRNYRKENSSKYTEEVLIGKNIKVIADCFIFAIEEKSMTYREFKLIQEILDNKYWKPSWVSEKKIK